MALERTKRQEKKKGGKRGKRVAREGKGWQKEKGGTSKRVEGGGKGIKLEISKPSIIRFLFIFGKQAHTTHQSLVYSLNWEHTQNLALFVENRPPPVNYTYKTRVFLLFVLIRVLIRVLILYVLILYILILYVLILSVPSSSEIVKI